MLTSNVADKPVTVAEAQRALRGSGYGIRCGRSCLSGGVSGYMVIRKSDRSVVGVQYRLADAVSVAMRLAGSNRSH